jgi:hypothetical protein
LARSGELPLGSAEGLNFVAHADSDGMLLTPSCDYVLKGPMPAARYWTLSLTSVTGLPIANRAERYGFTSAEVLRNFEGEFEIALAAQARPGNWLPTPSLENYVLALRLYDTALNVAAAALDAAAMPKIIRGHCK